MRFKNWLENRRIDFIDYENNPPDDPYALHPDVVGRISTALHRQIVYIRTNDNGAFSEWDDSVLERLLGAVNGDAKIVVANGPDRSFEIAQGEDDYSAFFDGGLDL